MLCKLMNRASDLVGYLAATIFLLIGLMICFEVVARYVFLAPTSWAEEGSRLLQLWATYGALAFILKEKSFIRIAAVTALFSGRFRVVLEAVALVWIVCFSAVAVWYGIQVVMESIAVGRTSATMNQIPMFWTETAIPVGFSLLILQALCELFKLLKTGHVEGSHDHGESSGEVI